MMIRTLVIDDESAARKALIGMVHHYAPSIDVIGEAGSVQEALLLINQTKPDLIFLDIEMQEGTGFELLLNLPERNFALVFVTAFEQYALESFRFGALDYLLKPIRIHELRQAVAKATSWVRARDLETSIEGTKSISEHRIDDETIIISSLNGFSIAKASEIIYCEAAGSYTVFYLTDGRQLSATRMIGEYEPILSEKGFMRVHKSFIVNLSHVTKYFRGRGGEVLLTNGTRVPVARERKDTFIAYFEARFGSF